MCLFPLAHPLANRKPDIKRKHHCKASHKKCNIHFKSEHKMKDLLNLVERWCQLEEELNTCAIVQLHGMAQSTCSFFKFYCQILLLPSNVFSITSVDSRVTVSSDVAFPKHNIFFPADFCLAAISLFWNKTWLLGIPGSVSRGIAKKLIICWEDTIWSGKLNPGTKSESNPAEPRRTRQWKHG